MTPLLLTLFLDPCAADTSSWKTVSHGAEEIRLTTEGKTTLLALRNNGPRPTHVDVVFRELGLPHTLRVFDLTANRNIGKTQGGFARKLPPAACAAYRLSK